MDTDVILIQGKKRVEQWMKGFRLKRFGLLLGFIGIILLIEGWESIGWSFLAAGFAVIFLSREE